MAITALQKITKGAKLLQKKNKSLSWQDAIKKSSAAYRKEKPAAKKTVGKKPAARKAIKKYPGRHTDTKSHNVNIRVMSGAKKIGSVKPDDFTRINNDANGNPRYVIHFLQLLTDAEKNTVPFNKQYDLAVKRANKVGGKKYHTKQYGGGIVFQSYNTQNKADQINDLLKKTVGSVLLLEKGESARKKPARIYQVNRSKAGTYKKFKRLGEAGTKVQYDDPAAVQEILLFADNDVKIYDRYRLPIEKMLYKHWKKGNFSVDKAAIILKKYIEAADKEYDRQYGDGTGKGFMLSVKDRKLAAQERAKELLYEFTNGMLAYDN